MKKKLFVFAICIAISACFMFGCQKAETTKPSEEETNQQETFSEPEIIFESEQDTTPETEQDTISETSDGEVSEPVDEPPVASDETE